MGIAAVYFLVAAGSSLLILNTLRPQRALAALKSEPPKPADPWPVLQPLLDGWRSTERMLGKVGGLLYSALAGLIVMNASNPAWVRSLVSLTVLYVGSVAFWRFSVAGALFGLRYAGVVRAHPEYGINPLPVASAVVGGAVSGATAALGTVMLMLSL